MVTILAVCVDWVRAKLVTEPHAGTRTGCICHSEAEAMGESGGPRVLSGSVTEQFDQPCWTFTSAPVYTSVTHAQAFVPRCLKMPLASSQLPIVVIF